MLETTGYNVEGGYHKLLKGYTAEVKADLAAAPPAGLGKTYDLLYYAQSRPLTYPCVTSWFYLPEGHLTRSHRRFERVQMEVWTQSPTPDKAEARRLCMLIRATLMQKIGFRKQRARYRAEFPLKDYFANPAAPVTRGKVFLELASAWQEREDPDNPLNIRQQADFTLIFV